jgi:hypothetical protein
MPMIMYIKATYSWVILLRGPKASLSRLERSLSWRLRILRLPRA